MTLVEALFVAATLAVVAVVATVLLSSRSEYSARRRVLDSAYLREIGRGITMSSDFSGQRRSLPSLLDARNATIAAPARTKDTTANILSSFIWNGSITIEQCISAAEINPRIVRDPDYRFGDIPEAPDPTRVCWDPAFSADFTGASIGNVSFALLQPAGGRLAQWPTRSQWSPPPPDRMPFASNRGPEITGVGADDRPTLRDTKSATLRIHGDGRRWRGNVGFFDGSVAFEDPLAPRLVPAPLQYTRADGSRVADLLFFDEPDDPKAANAYLGIFITAGERPADYRAIWD